MAKLRLLEMFSVEYKPSKWLLVYSYILSFVVFSYWKNVNWDNIEEK